MNNEERKMMVEEAAGIVSLTKGKVKIVKAMEIAGFSTPERKNMTLHQQVRRRSQKIDIKFETKGKSSIDSDSSLPSSVHLHSQGSSVSGLSSNNSQSTH